MYAKNVALYFDDVQNSAPASPNLLSQVYLSQLDAQKVISFDIKHMFKYF